MSKITLEMKSDRINSIISDYCTQDDLKDIEKDSQEEMVDIRVFNLMETMYPDNIIVAQNKKNEPVYKLLKSKNMMVNVEEVILHYLIILKIIRLI